MFRDDSGRSRTALSNRALRARERFDSVEQVTVLGLYRLKNVGRKTVKEIKEVFSQHGIRVPEGEPISRPIRDAEPFDWNKIPLNRWGKGMLIDEVRRLRAENARMREGLEIIATCPDEAVHLMPLAAQAALAPTKEGT
jgi:hypothetical protein